MYAYLLFDIDNILRFKLEKYFNNYFLLLKEKLGKENAGANWAEFLEYGTTDRKIIELQNIGFPRHLAKFILDNHSNCLTFEDDILLNFDHEKLEDEINKQTPEYEEIKEYIRGNICRCTGYVNIVRAIKSQIKKLNKPQKNAALDRG